jgi:hypothetical protein
VSWVKVALGLLLLLVAGRQFRGRPRDGARAALPKWMARIDDIRPLAACGLAALLAGVNPKNLLLAVGGAASIAQTGISGGQQAIAYLVFALVGTLGWDPGQDLLRARPAGGQTAGRPEGLDGTAQRRDHVGAVSGHRGQAHRRCHQRAHRVAREIETSIHSGRPLPPPRAPVGGSRRFTRCG